MADQDDANSALTTSWQKMTDSDGDIGSAPPRHFGSLAAAVAAGAGPLRLDCAPLELASGDVEASSGPASLLSGASGQAYPARSLRTAGVRFPIIASLPGRGLIGLAFAAVAIAALASAIGWVSQGLSGSTAFAADGSLSADRAVATNGATPSDSPAAAAAGGVGDSKRGVSPAAAAAGGDTGGAVADSSDGAGAASAAPSDSASGAAVAGGPARAVGRPREVLNGTWTPLRYSVELKFDPAESTTFTGVLSLSLHVDGAASDEAVKRIELHAKSLQFEVNNVSFRSGEEGAALRRPINMSFDEYMETVAFDFAEPLPLGNGTLELSYAGLLSTDMAGLYKSSYVDSEGRTQYIAVTQLEAISARRVLPCWDEPAKKATFNVTLVVPANLSALGNMPVEAEIAEGAFRRTRFAETPRMSAYLLAVAVGRFDWISAKTDGGVLVRVLTPPGQKELGRFALSVAVRGLDFYADYFKVPFPLPKIDLLAAPDFAAGAMENWGLVIFREVELLCDEATVAMARRMRIAKVVLHELAHMWFGNYVTLEWWDHLWLNEGFANWMQTFAADALFPDWLIWQQYVVEEQSSALSLDALRSTHPIEVPVPRAQDVEEVFDMISYAKGGSVVRMLHSYLGERSFRDGIVLYMQRHAYGSANTTDLWACLEEASGEPVGHLMGAWTRLAGFPLLTVREVDVDPVAGQSEPRFILSQRRFRADGCAPAEPPSSGAADSGAACVRGSDGDDHALWQIPLEPGLAAAKNYSFSGTRLGERLFGNRSGNWPLNDNMSFLVPLIKFNAGQQAPYRVFYDSLRLRNEIARAVAEKKLAPVDRIGYLLDNFALLKEGSLPPEELVPLLTAFSGEDSPHAWEALASTAAGLRRAIAFADLQDQTRADESGTRRESGAQLEGCGLSQGEGASTAQPLLMLCFDQFLASVLVRPALKSFGWSASPGSEESEELFKQRRALVISLAARVMSWHQDVQAEAMKRFQPWISKQMETPTAAPGDRSPTEELPDDLKSSVFRIAVRSSQPSFEAFWQLLKVALRPETPQSDRLLILSILGEVPEPDLRLVVLNLTLADPSSSGVGGGVRLQDVASPVSSVAFADPEGAALAWDWFVKHRSLLEERLRGSTPRLFGSVLQASAGGLPSARHADAVEAEFRARPAAGLERSVAQVVERLRMEARFVKRLRDSSQRIVMEIAEAFGSRAKREGTKAATGSGREGRFAPRASVGLGRRSDEARSLRA